MVADTQRIEKVHARRRMSPSEGGYRSGAILVAATGTADGAFRRIRHCRTTAVMSRFSKAASVRRRGCDRQRQRSEASREREKQQQSGGQAMHLFCRESEPRVRQA